MKLCWIRCLEAMRHQVGGGPWHWPAGDQSALALLDQPSGRAGASPVLLRGQRDPDVRPGIFGVLITVPLWAAWEAQAGDRSPSPSMPLLPLCGGGRHPGTHPGAAGAEGYGRRMGPASTAPAPSVAWEVTARP